MFRQSPRLGRRLLILSLTAFGLTGEMRAQSAASSPQSPGSQAEAEIESRYKQATDGYEKAFDEFEHNAKLDQPFHHDMSPITKYLTEQMRAGPTSSSQQLAALYLAMMHDYEVSLPEATYAEISRFVPPESALWNKVPDSIRYIAESLPPEAASRFLQALVDRNPDRILQAQAAIGLVKLAARQRDAAGYESNYQRLAQNYKDLKEVGFDISLLNPKNKSALGKKAALFSLPSANGSATFSNQSLAGKYYLIDFWATWCGPCLGERAALSRAYKRFQGKNFAIVSISLDEKPEAVKRFRKTRWSMPWENLFLPGGQESQTAKDYDVNWIGLPHMVLVGPDGTIVALRDQLGRESIQQTLASYLGP